MITLTVISFNDAPPNGALTARFDELGGTIGRADTNQLVLPDPERTISRVAAQVVFRSGSYAIVDRGSNPISVNGKALGSGREAPLNAGDKVRIGAYVMQVAATAAGAAGAPGAAGTHAASGSMVPPTVGRGEAPRKADPFADLLGPAAAAPAAGAGKLVDPLAALQASGPVTQSPAPPPAAAGAASAASGIPDNWDPFAPPTNWGAMTGRTGTGRAAGGIKRSGIGLDTGAAAPAPLVAGLSEFGAPGGSAPKGDSLDALFGLKPGGTGADPLAASKLEAPIAQPNMAAHADPMRALGSAPKATAATEQDALSDLQRPFIPPTTITPPNPDAASAQRARSTAPPVQMPGPTAPPSMIPASALLAPTPAPAPAAPPAAPAAAPASGAVLSWASGPSEATSTIVNAAARRQRGTEPAHDAEAAARPATAGLQAVPRTTPQPRNQDHALLAAFLQGLAIKESPMTALTPEFMRLVGAIVREAVSGTVDLLVARAAMKRELRAQATTIVARDNNPLKFSPSAEAALQHILSPPVRGFMPAVEAMRDAYGDLRAHQLAFVAGMQAALEGVLERFDPQTLEGQLSRASVLSSLLPGSRKAKLWEVFVDHYTNIREQASDDFHTLFGKAFLKAYEEQLEQMQPTTTQPGVKR